MSEATHHVLADIEAERFRQMSAEGWTTEHDDAHTDGSMAAAAACYANPEPEILQPGWPIGAKKYPRGWPASWARSWWKPTDRRRDLVKAAALIVAEIERLDRTHPGLPTPSPSMEKEAS